MVRGLGRMSISVTFGNAIIVPANSRRAMRAMPMPIASLDDAVCAPATASAGGESSLGPSSEVTVGDLNSCHTISSVDEMGEESARSQGNSCPDCESESPLVMAQECGSYGETGSLAPVSIT